MSLLRFPDKHQSSGRFSGFTLIELLVTIAVLSIIAGIATPSFIEAVRNSRARSVATEMASIVNYARSEAIKRSASVSLCRSSNPDDASPACTSSGDWSSGWVVFLDADADGVMDTGETVLRISRPGSSGVIISSTTYTSAITFNSRGTPGSSGTFDICSSPVGRTLDISTIGRLHISKGTCS